MAEEQKEERLVEMAALKLPTDQINFIRKNQKLGQKAGKVMIMLHDMKKSVKALEELLNRPALFKEFLEDGTEEELEAFLKALLKANEQQDGIFHVKGIPEEAFDKVVSKMGDGAVVTKTTDAEVPKVKLFERKEHS